MTHTSNERHQDLIANKEALFRAVSLAVLAIAPSATSIWCFGLNVMADSRNSKRDWDFIAMLPPSSTHAEVQALNDLNSPLAKLRNIAGHQIEVQALRIDEQSNFAILLRREGFSIWSQGMTIEPVTRTQEPKQLGKTYNECIFKLLSCTHYGAENSKGMQSC
ncbi:hypothetical protein LCGC14_0282070 [marine sediment metagenome]|uniref:Uncharacterized protein n=1 Tax=marine sediment metagenome TaxID=412755 RepID=A0A0F9X0V7_9ZZZZ